MFLSFKQESLRKKLQAAQLEEAQTGKIYNP